MTCCACCVGDDSGEPLDSDDLSETECIDCICENLSATIPEMTPHCHGVHMVAVKTHIDLRQQPGAELHVIIQVEGPSSLKLLSESCDGSCVRQFLHAAHSPELLMRVLGSRETRSPTGAARVILSCRVLVSIVVVVGGHYRIMKTYEVQSSRMKCWGNNFDGRRS